MKQMHPDLIPVVGFIMVSGTLAVLGVGGFAVIRKIMASTAKPVSASDEHVEELENRVLELEERLDFHERVLTEVKQQTKLEPGAE